MTLLLPPRGRETAREYALLALRENIIHLRLAPGSRVSENELARQLGLSRTPVREALVELSRVEAVRVSPQRGCFISLVDYALVDEARFLRETLELAVVARCCALPTAALAPLRENLALQALPLQDGNGAKLFALDDAFHALLFTLGGAPHVHALTRAMSLHLDRVRAMSLATVPEGRNVADHQAIYAALAAGDAQAAQAAMHLHLTRYQIDRAAIARAYPDYLKAEE